MRGLVILLLAVTATIAGNIRCPKNLSVNEVVANQLDVTKYYRCTSVGRLQEEHCPEGLMFNAEQKLCDQYISSFSEWRKTVCRDNANGFRIANFANECRSYLICENGWARESECGLGYKYNSIFGYCDYEQNVVCECVDRSCPPCPPVTTPCPCPTLTTTCPPPTTACPPPTTTCLPPTTTRPPPTTTCPPPSTTCSPPTTPCPPPSTTCSPPTTTCPPPTTTSPPPTTTCPPPTTTCPPPTTTCPPPTTTCPPPTTTYPPPPPPCGSGEDLPDCEDIYLPIICPVTTPPPASDVCVEGHPDVTPEHEGHTPPPESDDCADGILDVDPFPLCPSITEPPKRFY